MPEKSPSPTYKILFFTAALPAVMRASWRVWRLERRLGLEELTDQLRRGSPLRFRVLHEPRYLEGCVNRLLRVLPPWHLGPCLKRSYMLVDLWSRCGLEPELHLGMIRSAGGRHFHAWVTVPGSDTASRDTVAGYHEIWSR